MSKFINARWKIIVNPSAANGKVGKLWPKLEVKLGGKLTNYAVSHTQYSGHAIQLAIDAIADGFRHIIVVGGDGTNHEVTNGILRQRLVPAREIFYALLPVGTGNDWIRMYGIPRRIDDWLEMLEQGFWTRQDAGLIRYRMNDNVLSRYFVNVAGMAYDGFVVRYGEQHKSWIRNRFFYLLLILRCLFKYRLDRAVIQADGHIIEQQFYTINIGICRFSGGGMQLVPQADPSDGLLALTYAGPVSKLGVLLNTWRFYQGSIGEHPMIELRQARRVYVKASGNEAKIPLEADGEFLGYSPADFSVIPDALTVIIPRPEAGKSDLPGKTES